MKLLKVLQARMTSIYFILTLLIIIYLTHFRKNYTLSDIINEESVSSTEIILNQVLITLIVAIVVYITGKILVFLATGRVDSVNPVLYFILGVLFWTFFGSIIGLIPIDRNIKIIIFLSPIFVFLFNKGKQKRVIKKSLSLSNYFKNHLFIFILMFLFSFGFLVPPIYSGDGYEHYYPYYEKIYLIENTLPNEVWYHFDLSRNYGLEALTSISFGPLSYFTINGFFAILVLLIFFELVFKILKSLILANISTLILGYTLIPDSTFAWEQNYFIIFDTLRHQYVNTILILSVVYLFVEMKRESFLFLYYIFSLFTLGWASPYTGLLLLFALLIFLVIAFLGKRHLVKPVLFGVISVISGVVTSFILNLIFGGYIVSALLARLWVFSDHEKFIENFGFLPLIYWSTAGDLISQDSYFQFLNLHHPLLNLLRWVLDGFDFLQKGWVFFLALLVIFLLKPNLTSIIKEFFIKWEYTDVFLLVFSINLSLLLIFYAFTGTHSIRRNSASILPISVLLLILVGYLVIHIVKKDFQQSLTIFITFSLLLSTGLTGLKDIIKHTQKTKNMIKEQNFSNYLKMSDEFIFSEVKGISKLVESGDTNYFVGYKPSILYSAFSSDLISEPSYIVDKKINIENIFSDDPKLAEKELVELGISNFVIDTSTKPLPGITYGSVFKGSNNTYISNCANNYMKVEIGKSSQNKENQMLINGLIEFHIGGYFDEIIDVSSLHLLITSKKEDEIVNINQTFHLNDWILQSSNREFFKKFITNIYEMIDVKSFEGYSVEQIREELAEIYKKTFFEIYDDLLLPSACDSDKILNNIVRTSLESFNNPQRRLYMTWISQGQILESFSQLPTNPYK